MYTCNTKNNDTYTPENTNSHTPESIRPFDDDRIGKCHILPSFLTRKLDVQEHVDYKDRTRLQQSSCIPYTIPYESTIKIDFLRNPHACLYGTTRSSVGLVIKDSNEITIKPTRRTAKIVRLDYIRLGFSVRLKIKEGIATGARKVI
jgi:hypothetical protein